MHQPSLDASDIESIATALPRDRRHDSDGDNIMQHQSSFFGLDSDPQFILKYKQQSAADSSELDWYARAAPDAEQEPLAASPTARPSATKTFGQGFADILDECDLQAGRERIGDLLDTYLAENSPDRSLVDAICELRSQFHRLSGPSQPKYPGRTYQGKPTQFLTEHFADDIAEGKLGPGQLALIDRPLYNALRYELSQLTPPTTIRAHFESARAVGRRITRFQRRVSACATLLETTEENAARFFGGMRPDRVRSAAA